MIKIMYNLSRGRPPIFRGSANLSNWGIHNLNNIIISRVLRIFASQKGFKSLSDKIFNADIFLDSEIFSSEYY